jgi:hypothetical protein
MTKVVVMLFSSVQRYQRTTDIRRHIQVQVETVIPFMRMRMNMVVVARHDKRIIRVHFGPVMPMVLVMVVVAVVTFMRVRMNVVVVSRHDQRIVRVDLGLVMSMVPVVTMMSVPAPVHVSMDVVPVARYDERVVGIHFGTVVAVVVMVPSLDGRFMRTRNNRRHRPLVAKCRRLQAATLQTILDKPPTHV